MEGRGLNPALVWQIKRGELMKNILNIRLARLLILSERAGQLKVPVKTMAARVRELIGLAEGAGFGFSGPLLAARHPPHLMAYASLKAAFYDQRLDAEFSCWVDGAVALNIKARGKEIYRVRIDQAGRITQEVLGAILPENGSVMIGELLAKAEKRLAAKYPSDIPGNINEVYILTTIGSWICRCSTGKSRAASAHDAMITKKIITALNSRGLLHGFVYIGNGGIVKRLESARPGETLIFNGFCAYGTRLRVYELGKVSGHKKVVRFVGAFDSYKAGKAKE